MSWLDTAAAKIKAENDAAADACKGQTIIVRLADWSRYEAAVVKVTHHTDAGHKYSRVHHRLPDGGTTMVIVQGHFGSH
jgi:hypothetical protein